jgi:hypothetical protein
MSVRQNAAELAALQVDAIEQDSVRHLIYVRELQDVLEVTFAMQNTDDHPVA